MPGVEANTASVAPATGAAGNQGAAGTDPKSSLINDVQKFDTLSLDDQLRVAVDAEKAARENQANATESTREENTDTQPTSNEGETSETEATPANEEGNEPKTSKGVIVRAARFKKLLEANAKLPTVEAQLERVMALLEGKAQSNGEGEPQTRVNPVQEIESRVVKARAELKAAKENFDADAEIQAQEALTDAKADLRALQLREEMQTTRKAEGFQNAFSESEKQFFDIRESLWKQDEARFPELADEQGDLYETVRQVKQNWYKNKNPILLNPKADRLAVEQAAAILGMEIPDVTSTPATPSTVVPAKSKEQVNQRPKTSGVIKGSSPGGTPPVSSAELEKRILAMDPTEALKVLAQLKYK